jgi:Amt family ammonium transporter
MMIKTRLSAGWKSRLQGLGLALLVAGLSTVSFVGTASAAQDAAAPAVAQTSPVADAAVTTAPMPAEAAPAEAARRAGAGRRQGRRGLDADLHLLVLLMTMPGLALFYGGLVRAKNMLSVLMQVFTVFSLIGMLWVVYGYSLAFADGNRGRRLDKLFLKG